MLGKIFSFTALSAIALMIVLIMVLTRAAKSGVAIVSYLIAGFLSLFILTLAPHTLPFKSRR